MKRIIVLLVALMMLLCACNKQPTDDNTAEQSSNQSSEETEENTEENVGGENAEKSSENTADEKDGKNTEKADGKTEDNSDSYSMPELNSDNMQPEWTEDVTESSEPTTLRPISEATTVRTAPEDKPSTAKKIEGSGYDLGDGVVLLDFYSYSGKYVEDGTDAQVENIAAILIENTGSKNIQYSEITVTVGSEDYLFNASTLLPGTKMIVLECNRKGFNKGEITACGMTVSAEFSEAPDTLSDKLTVQLLDGVVNVKNVSGKDIDGTLRIYLKNTDDGVYFGGITYRISIDSIAKGEIKQLSASHISADNSKVVFVTVAE